jgi:hypothetical protein
LSLWLEIILPVRNPGEELLETGASLASQTDRSFGVILSDNFSTGGQEIFARFCDAMKAANIPVRRVKPPREFNRVQHWNWAHGQAEAEWLKPLFSGDSLKPGYVERLRQRVEARPQTQIVRCEFETNDSAKIYGGAPFKQNSLTPVEFLNYFPVSGGWIGGTTNMAYRRAAWQATGGWLPTLPACGDLKLNAMLALRYGLETIHESLAVSPSPAPDFLNSAKPLRVNRSIERWLIFRQLRNYCLSVNLPWPKNGVARGLIKNF